MVKVVIVSKGGSLKESSVKNFNEADLFKKGGFRKSTDFSKRIKWKKSSNENVSLYAKDKGRAGSENKYELPPPIDKDLYFGSLVLVLHTGDDVNPETVDDFTCEEWKKLREKLFGGFEDLTKPEEESSEEEIPEHYKTKEGYSKEDGFIVDDDEDLDEEYIPEESEEEAHSSTDSADEDEEIMGEESDIGNTEEDEDEDDEEEEYEDSDSDVGSELSEESYVDSDCN